MRRRRTLLGAALAAVVAATPVTAGVALLSACGDAFSSHLPGQKAVATMVLLPDNARVGEVVDVHAVIYTSSGLNYVTRYDLGQGIDVLYFDTGGGLGCEEVDTTAFETTPGEPLFALCLTVATRADAALGEREVSLEVESDGTAVLARASFWVLPAYPFE